MSPAIQGDYISDLDPLASITQLPGGLFEVEVPAGPVAGAYVTRRLTTEQLVTYLGAGLGPNESKSLLKEFRFYRKADRDADGYGGACFETDLDWATCCGNTVAIIDFYRESDTEPFRNQKLVCVYDPNPTDPTHKAWVDGSFTGLRNPSKFVPVESAEAQLANIPVFDPTKTNYPAGTVVQYTIGGQVYLYKVLVAGGPYPAPTAPDGSGTADLQAVGKPTGNATSTTTELQISSETGKRTAVVKLVQPLSLLSVVALAANNVQAYALQVNTYTTSWQAGPARASLAAAQADLDALTSSQYAAGAELEITTTAVDDTAEAILILSFRA